MKGRQRVVSIRRVDAGREGGRLMLSADENAFVLQSRNV
jgi:hypothetical protein